MFIKSMILALALAKFIRGAVVDIHTASIQNLETGKDLYNFEQVFNIVKNIEDPMEKVSGLKELVRVMTENGDLYSNEIVQVTFLLKEMIEQQGMSQKLQEIKYMLPEGIQNLTCSAIKFWNTDVQGFLYADYLLFNPERRYTFADGAASAPGTNWKILNMMPFLIIYNEMFNECIYPYRYSSEAFTWVPGLQSCIDDTEQNKQNVWVLEQDGNFNKIRNPYFNAYLSVGTSTISGSRIVRAQEIPGKTGYWSIFCA